MFDIVFISYNEPNAEENWLNLKSRFPIVKRVDGVKGIHQAHIVAARKCFTKMFWVVDGDNEILEDFSFRPPAGIWEDSVYVYHSKNPINDLEYGYGGVKLLPTYQTANLNTNTTDMTTSISKNFFVIDRVAGVTRFNTNAFNTWKSAFRECVKLSSKVIDNQVDYETENRLESWCTIGKERPYGEWAIKGALDGKSFGIQYADNSDFLKKINDTDWLESRFKNCS